MGCDKNLRELNVISRFTIYVNCELRELWFSPIFVISNENLENLCVISYKIAKIMGIGRDQDFTI